MVLAPAVALLLFVSLSGAPVTIEFPTIDGCEAARAKLVPAVAPADHVAWAAYQAAAGDPRRQLQLLAVAFPPPPPQITLGAAVCVEVR